MAVKFLLPVSRMNDERIWNANVLMQVSWTQMNCGFMLQCIAKELHNAVCNCKFEIT